MSREDDLIGELAEAVMDGSPVDWAAAEADVSIHRLLAHLQVVAALAEVHRTSPLPSASSSPRPLADRTVHEMWGHLQILEPIGRGAFGDVYRAWDSRLDREVALKLIPASLPIAGASPAASIIEEGRLLARVRHPNVVTIHGAEQIGDRIGLWMELVRGRTLEESLRAGSTFTPSEAIRVGGELARAVAAVHAAGLLHRDIKAQNVMQADDGRIVLMDFGTGRELRDEGTDLAGTPLYLAPEVFSGQPASVQSDIYSLGVVLYHLLTGSYTVQGRTVSEVRRAHELNQQKDLRAERPDVPARLVRIIQRAIDPEPGRRYPSADAVRADLEGLAHRSQWRWLGYVAVLAMSVALASIARDLVSRPATSGLPSAVLPAGEPPSIAVLPFRNLSPEPDSNLVVDGLTTEVIGRLAAIDGLAIRSAAASFGSQESSADIRAVARELRVNLVLTGSMLASKGLVRVSAELVRVSDLVTVWSDTFTLAGGNVLAARDDISLAIVNRLRLRVGQGQRRYQIDPDSYYLFLKGRGLMARRHVDNAGPAAALFEQVIARDPSFAPAWAGVASSLAAFSRATITEAMEPPNPRMDEAALEAIRLDPLLAEAQAAMGSLQARDREWAAAEAAFRQALRLNPSLTTTHTDFVLAILQPMGRHEEAIGLLKQARDADPLSLDVRRVLALEEVDSGLYEDGIANARWVLERDPNFPYADLWLGRALALSGRADAAEPIFKRKADWFGYLGHLYAVTGRRREAEALAASHPDMPARQMLIYAGLGDKDRAIEALERAVAANWWRAAAWIHRPEMSVIRGDPRVDAIKRRLGLPQ